MVLNSKYFASDECHFTTMNMMNGDAGRGNWFVAESEIKCKPLNKSTFICNMCDSYL